MASWLDIFRASGGAATPRPAVLDQALAERLREAEDAWPGLRVDLDRFVAHLGGLVRTGDPIQELGKLRVPELYLAFAAGQGDRRALEQMESSYFSRLDGSLQRLAKSGTIDDLKQKLRESVLLSRGAKPAKIASYAGRGSLLRWLRAAAVNTALNELQTGGREEPGDDWALEKLMPRADSPELQAIAGQHREKFKRALRAAFSALAPEARLLLRHYYFEGLGVVEMGQLHRMAASTVSRKLAKARQEVAAGVRKSLREDQGLRGSDVDSLLRAVNTGFELSRSALED